MNANFGIIEPLSDLITGGKVAKYEVIAKRSLEALCEYAERICAQRYKQIRAEESNDENNS